MSAIPAPPVYQNPFMAPNNFSEIHLNSFQTDTFSIPGPGSAARQTVQQALIRPPAQIAGTIAFDSFGQIVTIRVGAADEYGHHERPDSATDRPGDAQGS